ncbi:hypothetical protein BU15DRAFT_83560 [Melanogaster broomeanus]|nr:hypothetical protein BU15DRAFT_83560 [Melanogaster broomeanus]
MSQERTRQTHICFRSAYNLAYEVVRPNDNSPTFVLDSDAYACNPQYMQECNFAIEMYEGKAKERSYGVRDEYRLSGFAAIEVLDNLEALVCERFGMFFLFDLDLESTPNLPDIQELDDAEVMRLVGGNSNDRRTASKPIWPVLPSLDNQETFPIGERPTWQAVIKAISDAPWTLMRLGDGTPMWLFLNKHWLADSSNVPGPACLEEAMTCWTVETVYRSVTACSFEACNANLPEDLYHVRSPWKVFCIKPGYLWQFHELMEGRDEEERFHILDRLGEIFSNLQCLPTSMATSKRVIGKPWVISKHGKVQFITNPMFYKILGLAETGAAIQRRAGPRAVKPTEEFSLDMYRLAGYDELLARQSLYLERRKLRLARNKKSNKIKKSRKPPPKKTRKMPSQDAPTHGPTTPSLDEDDPVMRESFDLEDTDILMQDVDGSEDGSIDMEDIIEEGTGKEDRDMVMEDPNSSEEEGRPDVLMGEESDEGSDYCMDEDTDIKEGQ